MPLVLAIFEVLARPAEENDQAAALEKQMLRRSYFAFIMTIAASGMNEVMANQGELQTDVSVTLSPDGAAQPGAEVKLWTERLDRLNSAVFLFSGAENIERVVFTIIQGAVDFPDPIAQKTCFITLSKLVELWGESLHPPCLHHYSSSQSECLCSNVLLSSDRTCRRERRHGGFPRLHLQTHRPCLFPGSSQTDLRPLGRSDGSGEFLLQSPACRHEI